MKIGINATCISNRPSGARQRFVGLFAELVAQRARDRFVFFEPRDCTVTDWFAGATNVEARRTPLDSTNRFQRAAAGFSYWPRALSREQFDIFESWNLPARRPAGAAAILTIHDVRRLRSRRGLRRWLYERVLLRSLCEADRVVTVSETMRGEILGFKPDTPISVIYNGIDPSKLPIPSEAELADARAQLEASGPFILSVGHLEPRKNYPALVAAMALVAHQNRDLRLIIVGNDSGEKARISSLIREQGLEGRIRILSGIDDVQLACLYRMCQLVVFPSTYEGFGIPVLEAMAFGRPLALSDIPVFREIAGDAGVYFDPSNPSTIASRLLELVGSSVSYDVDTGHREVRLADFSYAVLAAKVSAIYDELAASG